MSDTTDIKKGVVLDYKNDLWLVTDFQFVNPGKGVAFYKTKMKSLSSGKALEVTFKSGESIDVVRVEKRNMQYLYKNEGRYSFMDKETYETKEVSGDVLGDDVEFLKEGLEVIMSLHKGNIVAMELPKRIEYTVQMAPPAVKGDTASGNVTKEVELENGLKIQAPIFISQGEKIYVATDTGDYSGRVTS